MINYTLDPRFNLTMRKDNNKHGSECENREYVSLDPIILNKVLNRWQNHIFAHASSLAKREKGTKVKNTKIKTDNVVSYGKELPEATRNLGSG